MNESLPRSLFTFHVRRAQATTVPTPRRSQLERAVFPAAAEGGGEDVEGGEADDESERDAALKP